MANNYFDKYNLEDILCEIERVYLNDNRPWIIGYSGGKDSTAITHLIFLMLENLDENKRHKPVYIVSSDTLIENPLILDYLKRSMDNINLYARKKSLPIKAEIIYPDYNDSFWANIIGKGYPTPKSIQYRWCTDRLKIKPSNAFIKNKLQKEDVVVILGVRKDESTSRKARIEKREIDGFLLTPHETLKGKDKLAYVYTPIVDFTTDDVWDLLYHKNTNLKDFGNDFGETPSTAWNTDVMELFNLYLKGAGDSGECPFIADENGAKSSCGNSRFGCWICTVVKEDKSLNGFIASGHDELLPLVNFRKWILDERDKPENRKTHKRNGSILKKNGKNTFGPFNFYARQKILRKLLETELEMKKNFPDIELINIEELKAIDNIWDNEEDLNRNTLVNIYMEVTGSELEWSKYKNPVFDINTLSTITEKCNEYNINSDLFNKLIIDTNKYKHFSNKTKLQKSINKILNEQWIHQEIVEQIEQESSKELENEN